MLWFWLLPSLIMTVALTALTIDSLLMQRRIKRRLAEVQAQLAKASAELEALECLTAEDAAWLARCDAMTEQPVPTWPLPEIGSFWEWNLGVPMGREVIEIIGTSLAPPTVRIKSFAGEREVSIDEFSQNALPAPLRRNK